MKPLIMAARFQRAHRSWARWKRAPPVYQAPLELPGPRRRVECGHHSFFEVPMKATYSPTAEQILARNRDFQKALEAGIASLPGGCYIEGKVGRIAENDEIRIMAQGCDPITLTNDDLKRDTTAARVIAQMSKK